MSDVVFVLGAGASKEGGAPLMAEFLDVADHLWRSNSVKEKNQHFENVFKGRGALQAIHSKSQLDFNNIESVFATFEMAKILEKMPGHSLTQINDLIISLKELIVETLQSTLVFPVKRDHVVSPNPYDSFCDLLEFLATETTPNLKVSIITFNYDLAIDYALYRNRVVPNYGLIEEVSSDEIPLLKLHGSLNWGICPKCDSISPWSIGEYFSEYRWELALEPSDVRLRLTDNLSRKGHSCGTNLLPEPVLVPPTWNKTSFHMGISKVWREAARELGDAENIFIIGYSLPETDAFFRYLYGLGTVGEKPLKRFWVFNPDSTGVVEERFNSILGPGARDRFEFFQRRFSEAIPMIRAAFRDFPP